MVCMWQLSGLFTFLPAWDLVCSSELPGPTFGMICLLTPLCCLVSGSGALFREPLKATCPVFRDSLGDPSWAFGSGDTGGAHPTHQRRRRAACSPGPGDMEVLFLPYLLPSTFTGFRFGTWLLLLEIWPSDSNLHLPILRLKEQWLAWNSSLKQEFS